MMHIALVHRDLHAITRGGIGTVYREIATRLRDRGHHLTLLTQQSSHPLNLPGTTMLTLPRIEDLDAHRQAVAEVLVALGPDVIECSSWEAEVLHYLRRPRTERAPVVVRAEFSAATMNASDLVQAERDLVHAADAVMAVSDFAARDLADAYDVPVPMVVPHGVDRVRFQPGPVSPPTSGFRVTLDVHGAVAARTPLADLVAAGQLPPPWAAPDDHPCLIWVGKVTPMKGWDRLEETVALLGDRAHLTVLLGHSRAFCPVTLSGEGDVTIIQDMGDADLVNGYRAADWLLSTSRWEGFGLAIAEALACGTPVLLPSDLGTSSELLAEGGGLAYDDADDLAMILQAPGKPVGRLPSRFDWDRNMDATLDIYQAVANTIGVR